MLPYTLLQLADTIVEALSEIAECFPVHIEACLLHLRKNLTQGQLYIIIEALHAIVPQLFAQRGVQGVHRTGPVKLTGQIMLTYPLGAVAVISGVEKIGRKRHIKDKALRAQALIQHKAHKLLHIAAQFLYFRGKDLLQKKPVLHSAAHPVCLVYSLTVTQLYPVQTIKAEYSQLIAGGNGLYELFGSLLIGDEHTGQGLAAAFLRCISAGLKAPFFNKLIEAKALEEVEKLRCV